MLRRLSLTIAALVLLAYAAIVLQYLLSPNFMDHLEPMVASSTWAFLKGRPIYHEAMSAERYAILYGPVLYLLTAIPLLLLGPSLFAVKAGAAAAIFASFGVLFRALRDLRSSRDTALFSLGWTALAFLTFPSASYWSRGEPWLVLLVTAVLWAAQALSPLNAAIACGLIAGALSGIKLHAAVYALPAFALLFERTRWKGLLIATLAAWLALAAPFLLFPSRISFTQMLFWIKLTSQHGVFFEDFLKNLAWGLFFMLPAIPLFPVLQKRVRPTTLFSAALLITLLLVSFTGSLKGAGRHHLLPWLPSLVAGYALLLRDARVLKPALLKLAPAAAIASAVILAFSAYRHTGDVIRNLPSYPGKEIIAELEAIEASYPGKPIEMGYGLDYKLSWYRPLLVFKQGTYLLDGAALMDLQSAGLVVTPKTLEAIKSCAFPIWLFPKGEDVLNLHHLAPPNPPIFDEETRAEFRRDYKKVEDRRFYSVWACAH